MRSSLCGIAIGVALVVTMPAAGMPAVVVVVSAGMSVLVVMVVALEVGAKRESAGEIRLDRRFRVAGNAADHLDAGFGKRGHRAAADSAADE